MTPLASTPTDAAPAPPGSPPLARSDLTALSPRARALFYLQAFARLALFWAPVTAVGGTLGAAFVSVPWSAVVALGWLFLQFVIALWWPTLSWQRWGYALRERDLIIARGVLLRSVTAIPIARIQHVDTRQGPLEQWLGLARIQIHTASGVGGDGAIPGLELAVAEALRDRLVAVRGNDSGDDGGV